MGAFGGPHEVTSGLIGYWDASNTKSYPDYNLLSYSHTFTNAYWGKTASIDSSSELAPDGSYTASIITDSSASVYQSISKVITVPNDSNTYNISIYVKKTTGGTSPRFGLNVNLSGGTSTSTTPRLNTDTGVVTAGVTESVGNYWRMSFTITNNGTGNTTLNFNIYPATGVYNGLDDPTATGSATIWGAQITRGSALLPYKATAVVTNVDSIFDLSGNNKTATLTDGPTFSSGSFIFDGVANRVHATNSFKWSQDGTVGYQQMTFSLWVKTTDTTGKFFSKPWNGTGEYNFWIAPTDFHIHAGPTATAIAIDSSIYNGNWNNIVCWMDSTNFGYYLNSTISNSAGHGLTGSLPTYGDLNYNLCLMSLFPYTSPWAGNAAYSINGSMAICKIYNRVLSAAEVKQNFNALRGRFGI